MSFSANPAPLGLPSLHHDRGRYRDPVFEAASECGMPTSSVLVVRDEPDAVSLIEQIGIDNVMAETDYPHTDSSWPNSGDLMASGSPPAVPASLERVSGGCLAPSFACGLCSFVCLWRGGGQCSPAVLAWAAASAGVPVKGSPWPGSSRLALMVPSAVREARAARLSWVNAREGMVGPWWPVMPS